jgi:superoxide reductase
MAKRYEIYKCEHCGNIVEVLHDGSGKLVCCDAEMKLMTENTVDASKEKHIPVIEKTGNIIKIKIGSVAHPMEDKHYIEWIELIADDRIYRKYLKPGDSPEAVFEVKADKISAREYCNLHGLWRS